ncbi:MAG: hypothetical protein M3O33_03290 [Cyanobacteriota bacterium]|nr:hypothetical protein [Cyanobacteriota bacterium]
MKELCYRGIACVSPIDYDLQASSEPSNCTWFLYRGVTSVEAITFAVVFPELEPRRNA